MPTKYEAIFELTICKARKDGGLAVKGKIAGIDLETIYTKEFLLGEGKEDLEELARRSLSPKLSKGWAILMIDLKELKDQNITA